MWRIEPVGKGGFNLKKKKKVDCGQALLHLFQGLR